MLIKLKQKTLDQTYVEDLPGDTKVSELRAIASERFRIPEAGIKMTVEGRVLNAQETIAVSMAENATVEVELDEENFESNENQQRIEKLLAKLNQSDKVRQLYAFYQKNERFVDPFILDAQTKLKKSLKIIRFVDELKKAEVVDRQQVEKQVNTGVQKFNETAEHLFPHSYLSYTDGLVDRYLQTLNHVDAAQELMSAGVGGVPALELDQPLRPQSLKGPESDFYELSELEHKNITTVLVENLFTEIAVLAIILHEKLQPLEENKEKLTHYRQKDMYEDMRNLYMVTVYNLMELIDIKDMLLGQYIQRSRKADEENAKRGYAAYIDKLRTQYQAELEIVMAANIDPAREAEALQYLQKTNGDVHRVIELMKQ